MNLFRNDLSRLGDLAQLARSTYENGEIVLEKYLEWEYKNNPSGNALVFVANEEQQIVSQYVVIPKQIIFEDKIISAALSLNTITRPGYRGKGYFTKLAELTYEECERNKIDFTFGFPNANSFNGFVSKLKFIEIGKLPLLVKIINPVRAIFNFIFSANSKLDIDNQILPFSNEEDYSIFDPVRDAEKYGTFWSKFKLRKYHTTDRTIEYLKWRYIDIPYRKYHLIKFVENNEITGIVVFRMKVILGIRCLIIMEFLSLNDSVSLKKVISRIAGNKFDILIATLPKETKEYAILKNIGFMKVPQGLMLKKLHMIIRKHNANISDSIKDFKKWFVTFGDYDIF